MFSQLNSQFDSSFVLQKVELKKQRAKNKSRRTIHCSYMFQQDKLLLNTGGWMPLPFRLWRVLHAARACWRRTLNATLMPLVLIKGWRRGIWMSLSSLKSLSVSSDPSHSTFRGWGCSQGTVAAAVTQPPQNSRARHNLLPFLDGQQEPWEPFTLPAPGFQSSAALNRPAEPRSLHQSCVILQS